MKVLGQLEQAQFENLAAAPTPVSTGRVYMDITNPLAAVPTVWNGTTWRALNLAQSASTIVQSSSKACTVDWSLGLNQQVNLTDNTVISFLNPVAGQTHSLIITQGSAPTTWRYTLNMPDQATRRQAYQPNGVIPSGEATSYSWFYQPGVRAAITSVPNFNPAPLMTPSSALVGVDISPDFKTITAGRTGTPFFNSWDVTESWSNAMGPLGLRDITTPAASAAIPTAVRYGVDNKSVYISTGTTPFIQGWLTNRGIPTTVFGNPGTLPTGAGQCIDIHPGGFFAAVGHATTPFISVYPLTGGGFGAKLTNPGTLPVGTVVGVGWCQQGDFLTVGSNASPFILTYPISSAGTTAFFGSVIASPGVLPGGGPASPAGRSIAWRPQGDYIAMLMSTSPYLYVVPFNRQTASYGVPLAVPVIPAFNTSGVAWSPDGQFLLVGCTTAPGLYIFDFSNFSLATVVSQASSPGVGVNDICIHPNGETFYVALNTATGFLSYQMPTKTRNYLRLNGPS